MKYLKSPTECTELRGKDQTGNGWFGAKRGKRKHEGVDYVAKAGDDIYAITNGTIRIGNVYRGSTKMKLIEITGLEYRVKQMYIDPSVKNGDVVEAGQKIGTSQNVAGYHKSKKMKNHVHISVWKNGLLTDPEPIIISN